MKNSKIDNASQRKMYVGRIFDVGNTYVKQEILKNINKKYSALHEKGYIHIHDLEAFDLTYNCLSPLIKNVDINHLSDQSDIAKLMGLFETLEQITLELGNEQSGGIGYGNFDCDVAFLIRKLKINYSDNEDLIYCLIDNFLKFWNNTRERCGQMSYYVSLNLGLDTSELGRFISHMTLDAFNKSSVEFYKPNIIFKVKKGVNLFEGDPNYDLLKKSIRTTCKKMIPTYLLCDAEQNRDSDPRDLSIMGCRTRILANINGPQTSLGRGNIANVTINLPRLALESKQSTNALNVFNKEVFNIMDDVAIILLERFSNIAKVDIKNFFCNVENEFWCKKFDHEVFKQGTLSIGFIGLSEAMEILLGKKFWLSKDSYETAIGLIAGMREKTDSYTNKYGLNFSLLAPAAEAVSGRFPKLDLLEFNNTIINKGYYTNSFHVEVSDGINPFDKIKYEGPFHSLCNGGSITYIELSEAPQKNYEAICELIKHAIKYNVNYLGFNFPLDSCNECKLRGIFDICPHCHSSNILRIRRVSGYLEILDYFADGKKQETLNRKGNI